jgi:hypothetical protein
LHGHQTDMRTAIVLLKFLKFVEKRR